VKKMLLMTALIGACARSSPEPAAPHAAAAEPSRAEPTPVASTRPAETAPASAPSASQAVLEEMQDLADRMCDCHDSQCAQKVADELQRWSEAASKRSDPPPMREEDVQRAGAIGERMGRCMQQVMQNGSAAP